MAFSIIGDWHLAEDAVQQTWMDAMKYPEFLDIGPSGAKRWLWKTNYFNAIDRLRRENLKIRQMIDSEHQTEDLASSSPEPVESAYTVELMEAFSEALASLSPKLQSAFVDFAIHGYSCEEIAESNSLPLNTVKTRIHRAKKKLVELMRPRVTGYKLIREAFSEYLHQKNYP